MKGIQEWFAQYGQSHRHPVNVTIHKLAVPGIYLCSLAAALVSATRALARAPQLGGSGSHSGAAVLSAAVVFAVRGDGRADRARAGLLPPVAGVVLLWIAQFVGHKIEGKRPSFLADLQFLLIGPAWVLASLYRRLGIPY